MTTSTPARPRARRTTRLTVGLIAGAALAIAAPLAASAHVHVTPEDAPAGAATRLVFSFSHGCDGSPTTALEFPVPEIADGVTPVLDGAWTITRELGDDGVATSVVYTAVTPIEDGISASVAMDVIFPESAADTTVAFPVLQRCADGANDWSQVAEEGEDPHDLESPAPTVAVGAVAAESEDGHATEEHTEDGHAEDEATATDAAGADPVARWLAGGALAASLAALGVTLFRRRG